MAEGDRDKDVFAKFVEIDEDGGGGGEAESAESPSRAEFSAFSP